MRADAFTRSSRNECRRVLRAVLYITRRRFRTLRALLYRLPVISHTARAFTSPVDGFARHACFYITRRRIRAPCVLYIARRRIRALCVLLHLPPILFHTARALTSPADGVSRYMFFYITRRRIRTPRVLFNRSSTDSHAMRSFASLGDDFAHCTRFYIARR